MSPAPDTEFLLLAAGDLHPFKLRARFSQTAPLSQKSVRVPSAYLSFAHRGVPFLEPCLAGAIVEGVNDLDAPLPREGRPYKRWVWERCAPGMEFVGDLPPVLEGVIFEFDKSVWASMFPSLGPLIEVRTEAFANGDPFASLGTFSAHFALPRSTQLVPNLTPSDTTFRSVFIGALLNALSQPYMGHLSQLRTYAPPLLKRLVARLAKLVLLPPFLLFHLPQLLLNRWTGMHLKAGGGFLGRWLSDLSFFALRRAEWCGRGLIGSGYTNEIVRT